MSETRHEALVARVVSELGCKHGRGFSSQLRHIPSAEMEDDRRFLLRRWPIPDAWRFDNGARRLTVYEVEDRHPMPDHVLAAWSLLSDFLDCFDWSMRLFRVSRWGQVDEVDLGAVFAEFQLGGRTDHTADHGGGDAR